MLKGKYRYRKFIANRARKLMLRKLSFKKQHKALLVCKAKGIPFVRRSYKNCIRTKILNIILPEVFSVFSNQDEIFNLFGKMLDMHSNRKLKQINLDLVNIKSLDSATVCLLLSVIAELSNYGIKVVGNLPDDSKCAKMFVESGFLNHMKNSNGRKIDLDTSNVIIETGCNETRNKNIGIAIRKSMENLTGKSRRYQPAYTVAMEICSNSVEHAYGNRQNKHWRMGAYKDDNRIAFTMTDTGVGILHTLHRKFRQEITDMLFRNNCEVLQRAFQRKYGSSLLSVNRNKGLPCILDKFQNNYIKNLRVITNDVYLNFENNKENKVLRNSFSGVLFYWEVDLDCIDKFDNDKMN